MTNLSKIRQTALSFRDRCDKALQAKIVFGLGSIGGIIGLVLSLTNNPLLLANFGQNWFILTFGWLSFMLVSSTLVIFGIFVLVFLEMLIPALQQRISKLKHNVDELKNTVSQAKKLSEQIPTLEEKIQHIHSTTPCLALQDIMTSIVNSKEKKPSEELRDEITRLQTKVESLTSLRREDSQKIFELESEIRKLKEKKESSKMIIADKFQANNQIEDSKP